MKLNTRNIVWVILGILFALGSLWIHYQIKVEMPRGGSPDPGQFQVGNEAPDFSAPDLRGREVVLSELQGHKVVVLDFWATWCGPCLKAMPDLEEVHREFAERGVVVVALNLGEDPERARSFIKRQGYTFRVVAGPALGRSPSASECGLFPRWWWWVRMGGSRGLVSVTSRTRRGSCGLCWTS